MKHTGIDPTFLLHMFTPVVGCNFDDDGFHIIILLFSSKNLEIVLVLIHGEA